MQIGRTQLRGLSVTTVVFIGLVQFLYFTDIIDWIVNLAERDITVKTVFIALVIFGSLSSLYFWEQMLVRCWRHSFSASITKWTWLVMLIGLNVFAAVIYYWIVDEPGGTKIWQEDVHRKPTMKPVVKWVVLIAAIIMLIKAIVAMF